MQRRTVRQESGLEGGKDGGTVGVRRGFHGGLGMFGVERMRADLA